MTILTVSFILFALGLGAYLLKYARHWLAVFLLPLVFIGGYVSAAQMLGQPRPEVFDVMGPDSEVLAFYFEEGEAIYVWVLEDRPVYLVLPWDMPTARQLRQAGKDSEKTGGKLVMRRGTPEGEMMFYPEPPQPLPPKTAGRQ